VPATLHASLMARLDRLGSAAREVAQAGAAIGREFSHELLAPVVPLGEAELTGALDRLTEAGLVFRRGTPPQAMYLFKHALVRDAAYSTLLRGPRQEIHAGIAGVLEREFPEIVAIQPELLAHHCTEAGLSEQAIDNWRRAGERAIERSANLEAVAHLGRGLEVLVSLPQGPRRDEQEIVLQVALIPAHWASRGWASPGAERAARRALELSQQLGADTPEHYQALWGVAAYYMVRGEPRTGLGFGKQGLEVAERLGDPTLMAFANFAMGDFYLWLGELASARAHLEQGAALCGAPGGRRDALAAAFR